MGYPQPGLDGVPPGVGYACTGYTAGGMPRSFPQEDCLVMLMFLHLERVMTCNISLFIAIRVFHKHTELTIMTILGSQVTATLDILKLSFVPAPLQWGIAIHEISAIPSSS